MPVRDNLSPIIIDIFYVIATSILKLIIAYFMITLHLGLLHEIYCLHHKKVKMH